MRALFHTGCSGAVVLAALAMLAACKPPPTDADLGRDVPEAEPAFASPPEPSPDTQGAVWVPSMLEQARQEGRQKGRLIYGIPGSPALMALDCVTDEGALPAIRITRLSPADEGAGALMALIGNGHIGRLEMEAVEVIGRSVWQGSVAAADTRLEPLAGPRQLTATVPGAGLLRINPSVLPMQLIEACRET